MAAAVSSHLSENRMQCISTIILHYISNGLHYGKRLGRDLVFGFKWINLLWHSEWPLQPTSAGFHFSSQFSTICATRNLSILKKVSLVKLGVEGLLRFEVWNGNGADSRNCKFWINSRNYQRQSRATSIPPHWHSALFSCCANFSIWASLDDVQSQATTAAIRVNLEFFHFHISPIAIAAKIKMIF